MIVANSVERKGYSAKLEILTRGNRNGIEATVIVADDSVVRIQDRRAEVVQYRGKSVMTV